MIRVVIPTHLKTLSGVNGEIELDVNCAVTHGAVLDALEEKYPMLKGTIRDHVTKKRRAFIRFFACEQDVTHEPSDALLPEKVVRGDEPYLIIGAMAGG